MEKKAQKVAVNGVQLHYQSAGNGPHSILCIPGGAAPSDWAFASQLDYFGREGSGYTIIAYDPRGYGYSRPPDRDFHIFPEYHTKSDATDAHQLMKTLGYSKFSVIGWCSGSVAAICLAARYSDSVSNLVTVGCRSYYSEHDIQQIKKMADIKTWSASLLDTFTACYGSAAETQSIWKKISDSVVAFYEQTDGYLCTEEMTRAVCPSLVIQGEKDYITPKPHAEHVCRHIPNSTLKLFREAGHAPHHSCAEEFNTAVEHFLTS